MLEEIEFNAARENLTQQDFATSIENTVYEVLNFIQRKGFSLNEAVIIAEMTASTLRDLFYKKENE